MGRSKNPTVVVGLGALGAEVLERLRALEGPRAVLLRLEPGAKDAPARVVDAVEALLGLGALLASSRPGDDRRPALDVYVVADLAEPDVADAVPALVQTCGAALLRRYSHIFTAHDLGNLTLCPVLALRGARGGGPPAEAARALGRLEEDARRALRPETGRPGPQGAASVVPRVFVLEPQTSRYELSGGELVSTLVSFLTLLLGTTLRDEEPLRGFLRGPEDQVEQGRIFASFGCATLEMTLGRYATLRGAEDLVQAMRAPPGAAAGSGAVAARRLVPAAAELEERLRHHPTGDDLVELLRAHAPTVDYPAIGWDDTPEQVRDVSYGWGWFESLERTVEALVRRLDEREMDELSRVADERGLSAKRELAEEARRELRALELSGPHGWAEALRLAEHVRGAAERESGALDAAIRAERLPRFPAPAGVESALRSLREEATLRPRPVRLVAFAGVAGATLGALLHFVPKWIVVALVLRQVPLLSLGPSSMDVKLTGALHYLLDPPYAFLWVTLACCALVGWLLARHRRAKHEALLLAREDLVGAVRRFLTDATGDSVMRYYESRLRFVLRAWAHRALRRVRDVAAEEATRLCGIDAALGRLGREFGADARRAEHGAGAAERGDLLFRTRASPEVLRAVYDAVRPPPDLAAQLFERALEGDDSDDGVPRYLLPERVVALAEEHVAPDASVLRDKAGPFVADFVAELWGRLGVPLEVHGFDERTAERRFVFAPEWATEALARARARIPDLPEPAPHGDPERVHLVTVRTSIARSSIAVLAEGKP